MKPAGKEMKPPYDNLPKCRVCGEKSSGFHYGVYVCVACKGFFKRHLRSRQSLTCSQGNGMCLISGKDCRRKCNFCRLKACNKAGMSQLAMRPGRYSKQEQQALSQQASVTCPYFIDETKQAIIPVDNRQHYNARVNRPTLSSGDKETILQNPCFCSFKPYLQSGTNSVDGPSETVDLKDLVTRQQSCHPNYYYTQTSIFTNTTAFKMSVSGKRSASSTHFAGAVAMSSVKFFLTSSETKEIPSTNSQDEFAVTEGDKELIEALVRHIEKFLDTETYFDEAKLTYMQTAFHHEYWSKRGPGLIDENALMSSEMEVICEDVMKFIDELVKGFIDTAQLIPGFSTLPVRDKINLFKANFFETWMCFFYPCYSQELQVMYVGTFSAHKAHIACFMDERIADIMWGLAARLKDLCLSKREIPVVWAVSLLDPSRRFFENPTMIGELRYRMVKCLKYLSGQNQLIAETHSDNRVEQILDVLQEMRENSKLFDEVCSVNFLRSPFQERDK